MAPSRLLVVLAFAVAAGGCRKSTPAAPPPAETELPPLEVTREGTWLFTHVTGEGTFATTDDPEQVHEAARRLVRVIDPTRAAHERRDTTRVYVLDLRELLAGGKATARAISREAFETGALAQLPPGASSLLADRPRDEPGEPDGGAAGALADGTAVVTLYGTSWCGACREARRYLRDRNIPFVDKDVERDPAAARELAEKAARLGVPADRVPILDVRGRLLIGFDRGRLEALLGEPT